MDRLVQDVESWIADARGKLAAGAFTATELDALQNRIGRPVRQRLLVLRATEPNIGSHVIGMSLFEPVKGKRVHCSPEPIEWPYNSIHDAVCDGWQIVHFPHLEAPFDDKEIDMLGYEYILQKLESYDD